MAKRAYNFGNQFVTNITKRNWAKPVEGVGSFLFGDERKKIGVHAASDFLANLGL